MMAEKRKRPIGRTPLPGEEQRAEGEGAMHRVELEGEEIELRQEETPLPEQGGTEIPSADMTRTTMNLTEPVDLPQQDEDFRQAVQELPPERQQESIAKRKRRA